MYGIFTYILPQKSPSYVGKYTAKHLVLPAPFGGHSRMCWKRGKNQSFFCIMANFMLYIGTHSLGTCASLLHIIIIIIIINCKETLNETLKKPSINPRETLKKP